MMWREMMRDDSAACALVKYRISKGDLLYAEVVATFASLSAARDYFLANKHNLDYEFRWSDWNEYAIVRCADSAPLESL